jgi:hypothetical protein
MLGCTHIHVVERVMAKAEPDLAEVNRLLRGEPGTANKTVDRSENARLKDCTRPSLPYSGLDQRGRGAMHAATALLAKYPGGGRV